MSSSSVIADVTQAFESDSGSISVSDTQDGSSSNVNTGTENIAINICLRQDQLPDENGNGSEGASSESGSNSNLFNDFLALPPSISSQSGTGMGDEPDTDTIEGAIGAVDISLSIDVNTNTSVSSSTDTWGKSVEVKNDKLEAIFDSNISFERFHSTNYYIRYDSNSGIGQSSPHSSFRESKSEDNIPEKSASTTQSRRMLPGRPFIVQGTIRCLLLYLINYVPPEKNIASDDQNSNNWRAFFLCYRDFTTPSEVLRVLTDIVEGKGLGQDMPSMYYLKELENGNLGLFAIEADASKDRDDISVGTQQQKADSNSASVSTILKCLTVDKHNAQTIRAHVSQFIRMWMNDENKDIGIIKRELLMKIACLCKQLGGLEDVLLNIRAEVELKRGKRFDLSFQSNLTNRIVEEEIGEKKDQGSEKCTGNVVDELKANPNAPKGLKNKNSDSSTTSIESIAKNAKRNYRASMPWNLSWKDIESLLFSDSDRERTGSHKSPSSIGAGTSKGQRRKRRTSTGSWREAYKEKSLRRLKHRLGEFNNYKEKQVAAQLTTMLCEHYYNNITRTDLSSEASMKECKHIQGMINLFNSYSWWSVTWVLLGSGKKSSKQFNEDVYDRVTRLIYMMNVAEECRKLRNFHTFFGIMGGLCQPHLSWIWEFAREKDKQRFRGLRRAVSPQNDYRVYKADLSKSKGKSCVPYLGLAMKSLVLLEKEMKPISEKYPHLVNFGRCVAVSNAIDNFLQGKEVPYIKTNFMMQNLFFRSSMNEIGTTLKINPKLQRVLEKQISSAKTREELEKISKTKKEQLQNQVWVTLAETGFL